jgi:hypothetical protein
MVMMAEIRSWLGIRAALLTLAVTAGAMAAADVPRQDRVRRRRWKVIKVDHQRPAVDVIA